MNDELDIVGLRMELARATARVEALENERMRLTSLKDEAFTKLDAAVKRAEAAEKMLNEGWVDGWRERAIALVSKHAPKTKGPKLNHDEQPDSFTTRTQFGCKHRDRYRKPDGTCSDCGKIIGPPDTEGPKP